MGLGLLGSADVTVLHKDFAKSKGWQTVVFCCGICVVQAAVALGDPGETALLLVEATTGVLVTLFGTVIGLSQKKLTELIRKLEQEKPPQG